MKRCSVDDCLGKYRAKGYCQSHYYHWRKYGDPLLGQFRGFCAQGHNLSDPEIGYTSPTGGTRQCRLCIRVNQRKYRLSQLFNLTVERFETLLAEQEGLCLICFKLLEAGDWCVDHDHRCCSARTSCGLCIRGILCRSCNTKMVAVDNWTAEELGRAQVHRERRPISVV